MTSINHTVWKLLAEDISIQKNLERGLINIRGLARYFITEHNLGASMDAVISAIRRYETEIMFSVTKKQLDTLFKEARITTKNNVACITLKEYEFEAIAKDFVGSKILKDNFRLIKSKENIKIFLNQDDLEEKKAMFSNENTLNISKDLSEIRISMPDTVTETVGILARIGQEVALEEVNVEDIISALPEFLLYVKSSDIIKAHKALVNLTGNM
jgi:hypothetical protein